MSYIIDKESFDEMSNINKDIETLIKTLQNQLEDAAKVEHIKTSTVNISESNDKMDNNQYDDESYNHPSTIARIDPKEEKRKIDNDEADINKKRQAYKARMYQMLQHKLIQFFGDCEDPVAKFEDLVYENVRLVEENELLKKQIEKNNQKLENLNVMTSSCLEFY